MSLSFPNRFVWLCLGIIVFIMLQSGCAPIQLPADAQSNAITSEASRVNLSTNIRDETTSPNGEWIAATVFQVPRASDEYYQSLTLTHASGSPTYTLVDGWFSMGLGYTVATPFTWSQDSTRFYYTNRAQADGCGILYNGSDLYQVSLATGDTLEILPANTTTKLALSPDEQRLAYLAIGAPTLLIQEVTTGESISVDLASILVDAQPGAFVWSPDNQQIAFAVAHKPCSNGWAEATSIYTIDTANLTLTPHLESDTQLLIPAAWESAPTLTLANQQGERFLLELATNTLTAASTSTSPITSTATISQ